MNHQRLVLFAVLAILVACAGFGVLFSINRPLGQTLVLQVPSQVVPAPALAPVFHPDVPTTAPVEETTKVIASMPAATQAIEPAKAAKTCGNAGSMRLLVIGLTTPSQDDDLGADAIRLVTIHFDQPSAAVLTLPAVLWVDTPALANQGGAQNSLTSVYTEAYEAAKNDPEGVRALKATQALAQTIVDNFGYVPDHYITIDDAAFIKYIDALGGVDIDLPTAVDGTGEGYGIYPSGPQRLDGTRTLNFSRLFHPNGMKGRDVWGNLERQDIIVKAILAGMLKPQNLVKIPSLMVDARQAVGTDLSLSQTLDLACMAQQVGESARMLAVGEEMVQMDSQGRIVADREAIRRLIGEMDGDY